MTEIKTFDFNEKSIIDIKNYGFGYNWPVVYIIDNNSDYYIGETISAYTRAKQHLDNPNRKGFKIHLLIDEQFNKSATLDIESSLIEFFFADGKLLQNGNKGLSKHDYYQREIYEVKFENIWKRLIHMKMVKNELFDLKNRDLFKYSPYKTLTEDQHNVLSKVVYNIREGIKVPNLISGGPGTGKSILAVYMMKYFAHDPNFKNLKIGLVVPMTSFRGTLKKVFKNISKLKASMVMGPSEVIGKDYDILIVDEAHRLKTRKNLNPSEYKIFDKNNSEIGKSDGNQLDWIFASSRHQILFYDEHQTVRSSDITASRFKKTYFNNFELKTQLRVKGGSKYLDMVEKFLNNKEIKLKDFENYEFKLYDELKEMVNHIKELDAKEAKDGSKQGLSRLLAGYAWDWKSRDSPESYDICIGDVKLRWNSSNKNWVTSENAINEVGCIHTIQGYDLNYAGVIIGPELSYDFKNKKFIIFKDKYKDKKGKASLERPEDLKRYILNIYRVLMTRGIKGTFLYICDPNLKKYFKSFI